MWNNAASFLFVLVPLVSPYKLLCIFSVPSRSHENLGKGFVSTLLEAGHEVTWVTPYADQKPRPGLTVISVLETTEIMKNLDMAGDGKEMSQVIAFARNITVVTAKNDRVIRALETERFDAVIVEWFMSDANVGYAAVQPSAVSILVNSFPITPYMEFVMDDIRTISTVPTSFSELPIPMNLWQRMQNTYLALSMIIGNWLLDYPKKSSVYEELFSPIAKKKGIDLPPLLPTLYNTSIHFINSHPSISPALSLPPNVVEIGGYHIDGDIPPLPKDLKVIMDSSERGVIYFSMGSVLSPSTFPEKTQQELAKVLGELPYTVLWKFDGKLGALPSNVHVRPWMPQNSILAHPKIRLFITHGGLLSTTEAVHFGVPVLCVPVFGDQPANAERARQAGFARKIAFSYDMAQALKEQALIILQDRSYHQKAKELSAIFHNRPVPPRKMITHYIDLAIKSRGAEHLRSKSHLYSWYERWMIDQILVVLCPFYIMYIVLKRTFRSFGTKQRSLKAKQKGKRD